MYSGSEGKNSKRSNLILSVFHPGQQIPWLGDIDYLGMKDTSKEYEDFPVGPPRTLSFQNASNLSWAGDNVIQVCAKSASLYSTCVFLDCITVTVISQKQNNGNCTSIHLRLTELVLHVILCGTYTYIYTYKYLVVLFVSTYVCVCL